MKDVSFDSTVSSGGSRKKNIGHVCASHPISLLPGKFHEESVIESQPKQKPNNK
jgi:hypothetical protein